MCVPSLLTSCCCVLFYHIQMDKLVLCVGTIRRHHFLAGAATALAGRYWIQAWKESLSCYSKSLLKWKAFTENHTEFCGLLVTLKRLNSFISTCYRKKTTYNKTLSRWRVFVFSVNDPQLGHKVHVSWGSTAFLR